MECRTKTVPVGRVRKANPFVLSHPVRDPRGFVGRPEELLSLFNSAARFETVVVTGERGIGKSSFISQLEEYLKGNPEAAKKYAAIAGRELAGVAAVRFRCQSGTTEEELRRGLMGGLQRNYASRSWFGIAGRILRVIRRAIELYLGGVVFGGDGEPAAQLADQNRLCDYLEDFLKREAQVGSITGIIYILDEVEDVLKRIDLGSFARSTIEAMAGRGFTRICFVIGGSDNTAAWIFAGHPSAMRSFRHIPLEGMKNEELAQIVTSCLEGTGVAVANEALSKMVGLANASPARLQMIAYECFDVDADGLITLEDVAEATAVLMKKFQVQIFGKFARGESWEDYRAILRCICEHEPASMTADEIARGAGLPPKRTQALCGHLKAGGVLAGEKAGPSGKLAYRLRNQAAALYFRLAEESMAD